MSPSVRELRQQLQQLQNQLAAGAVADLAYQAQKVELERRLLERVMADPPPEGNLRWLFVAIATVAMVTAGVGYWWASSKATAQPGMPTLAAPELTTGAPHGTESSQMTSMVERLALRLKDKPQDAEGWAMLARSYSVLGRHSEAVKAYGQALALRKDDANLLADYADSLSMQNNRLLTGEPLQLVLRALKLDPHDLKALYMAGAEAFDRKDYRQAINYWQQVVEFGSAEDPMVAQAKPSLQHAQQLAGVATASKS
jgi:cytochrome c-type biogenesis protein CcmH